MLKRIASFALVLIILICSVFVGGFGASAQSEAELFLVGGFAPSEGLPFEKTAENTCSVTVELEEGNYQFKLKGTDKEYGHPGTIKDTTVLSSSEGYLMSHSINAKCTLLATGGSYEFIFDTESERLHIIKDGFVPDCTDLSSLKVNFAGESISANSGDVLTYTAELKADRLFEDIQTILNFDETKLSLIKAEATSACPNISDIILNNEHSGVVALNASNVDGYDFTEGKVYLTLDFAVIAKGETTVAFIPQEMTAVDGTTYYSYSTKLAEGAEFTEKLVISKSGPSSNLSFSGASITLHNDISINFKANLSLLEDVGYTSPYVVFEMNGRTTTVKDYRIENGRLVFGFDNISPANMNDTVKATLYAYYGDTLYQSSARDYSVADYCYNTLSNYSSDDYAELRTLLVDLLNFGAASQQYTGYNENNLVNSQLTAEQKAWATQEKPDYKNSLNLKYATVENPKASFRSAGLNLEDSVTIRFKVRTASLENVYLKIETDSYVWVVPAKDFEFISGNDYYIYFEGLKADQMGDMVYATVYEGDTAVSNTITYSIESYAYSMSGQSERLDNLLEAMIKYGNSAAAYVN